MEKQLLKKALAFTSAFALTVTGLFSPVQVNTASAAKVTLKLSKTSATLKKGKKLTLKFVKKNVKKIQSQTWSSSKKSVATVTKKGVVTGKKKGKATISVKVKYIAKGGKKAESKTLKCKVTVTEDSKVTPTAEPVSREEAQPFIDLSSDEIVKEMGLGINLGNTLDAHSNMLPGEMAWQSKELGAKTTREYMKYVHDMGFNTFRIPVTWGNYINDDYSVNEEWIARVQEVVDYAIDEDMYVVINTHHDGADSSYWLTLDNPTHTDGISDADFAKVLAKFKGLWKTIATRFQNYDEHLLFAGMNEPMSCKGGWSGNEAGVKQEQTRINALNQAFVDTVRATGGNNDKRWLVCQPSTSELAYALDEKYGFQVPTDSAKRLMVEWHIYSTIAIKGVLNSFNESNKSVLAGKLKLAKEMFVDKGIPVLIGECGTLNTHMTAQTAEGFAYLFRKYGFIPAFWDDTDPNAFAIFNRNKREEISWDGYSVCENLLRGFFYDTEDSQIVEKPVLTPLTSFDLSVGDTLTLKAGEMKKVDVSNKVPADSNDVVVWGSSDSTVASVYDGRIVARGIGSTVITAASKYEGVKREIAVTVEKSTLAKPTTEIHVPESLTLMTDEQGHLDAHTHPAGNGADVHYASSNPDVAVVSSAGTIRGIKGGQVTITVTSSDGVQAVVPVTVQAETTGTRTEFDINLALHALYNFSNEDDSKNYGGTELGSTLNVTKDGTYTLVFDCATDLSAKAKSGGVTSLNGIAALYIKDWDVTKMNYTKSPDFKGQIRYTSIKVDGKELLPETTGYYDCINAGGVFDTGNPMNVWRMEDKADEPKQNVDLNGVSLYSHPITKGNSFVFEQKNPQRIEVTFELSGFKN